MGSGWSRKLGGMADISEDQKTGSPWFFVACLAILALSGAGLVLTIPRLFTTGDPQSWGFVGGLTIMVVGFGLLGFLLRPATQRRK